MYKYIYMVWPISDIFLKTVRFPAAADRVICWCSDEFLGDIFCGIPGVTKHGQGNLL